MVARSRPSIIKRQKEQARRMRQQEKEERRAQRTAERRERSGTADEQDPSIAGIVPGAQPSPTDEETGQGAAASSRDEAS